MKIAILSDIHSNLEALNAVVEALAIEPLSETYCLGDIVGYNANPHEVIEMIQKMNAVCVAGNHDHAAVGLTSTDYFNPVAKEAAQWTAQQLSETEKDWIKSFPYIQKIGNITLVHATPYEPKEWGYILTAHDAKKAFEVLETDLCFIGHSHLPFVFQEGKGFVFQEEGVFELKEGERYIVNAGSVGQPRDRNPNASFVLFDPQKKTVDFKRVPYDFKKTQSKILAAGLPSFLAERLAIGR